MSKPRNTRNRPSTYDNPKTAKQLETALQSLPDEWVICRDMRHAWAVMNNFYVTRPRRSNASDEIRRELVCMRCATVRNEIYSHTRYGLDKTSQSYSYPDQYQMKGVPRGVKPSSMIHQEQYRRAMENVAKEARGA